MLRLLSRLTRSRAALGAVAVASLLGVSGCLPSIPPLGSTTTNSGEAAPAKSSTGALRIGKAVRGDLTGMLTFAAPIEAKGEVAVVPRVIARLDALHVELGSRVRAG